MRKTYHWDERSGKLVEGPSPRKGDSGDGYRFSDRLYSDAPFKAHDGTVIDSRRKHKAYMRRHGLTTTDDFQRGWARDAEKRERFYQGESTADRRDDVRRAMEKHRG
jgi:hypothetical protein